MHSSISFRIGVGISSGTLSSNSFDMSVSISNLFTIRLNLSVSGLAFALAFVSKWRVAD